MNLVEIGLDRASEAFVVDYLAPRVKAGAVVTVDLVVEAIHAAMRHQMTLVDNADAMRLLSDRVWCAVRAKGGEPKRRTIGDAEIAAAPADARGLLSRHRTR